MPYNEVVNDTIANEALQLTGEMDFAQRKNAQTSSAKSRNRANKEQRENSIFYFLSNLLIVVIIGSLALLWLFGPSILELFG